MTIPFSPLLDPGTLVRSLASPPSLGRWQVEPGKKLRLYGRGVHAMMAALAAVRERCGVARIQVWFPGYFCDPVLHPVRDGQTELRFYPVTEALAPDWERLVDLVPQTTQPQVFVLVHYFGLPAPGREAREFCNQHGMVLLEDAAHVLPPGPTVGRGDFYFFSPHKVLSLPSLGILGGVEDWVEAAPDGGGEASWSGIADWMAKRLGQHLLLRLRVPWHRWRRGALEPWNGEIPAGIHGLSHPFLLKLLGATEPKVETFVARRRLHYRQLLTWTRNLPGVRPLFPTLSDEVCPMALPLRAEGGSRPLVERLRAAGIGTGYWWDIPPELPRQAEEFQLANALYRELFLLPIHQSLTTKQVDGIGRELQRAALLERREI